MTPSRGIVVALVLAASWPLGLGAQSPVRRTDEGITSNGQHFQVRAERVSSRAIVLDGRLDEAAWSKADSAESFTQLRPDPGEPATERTVAHVLYDGDAIYVGARLYDDHPDSIVSRLMRRDDKGYSDWFGVSFDSYDDDRTGFTFLVNPRGVRFDELIFNDSNEDQNWDAVWEAAARTDSLGWTVEIRIPLSQLRYAKSADVSTWGVQFYREIARRGEESFWAPLDPNQNRIVSASGTLLGLGRLPSPRRLEVTPYTLARLERAPHDVGDPFWKRNDASGDVGADVKYGLTPDLTLTGTINPDFGQVEADPSVVNLTAYETFFPEKRPFFQEGSDIFRFGIGVGDGDMGNEQLFYSRRIGRAPQGGLPDSAEFGQVPAGTTILGAGKLSGKTAGGWSVGVLDAVTGRETAPWVTDAGQRGRSVVEPLTNYAVGRVIKDFRKGESAVGGIFTSTSRKLSGTGMDQLPTSAVAGGMNFRHRWGGGDWELTGFALGSRVAGGRDAIATVQESPVHYFQRPDASHLTLDSTRTSLGGYATQLQFGKVGGGHWRGAAIVHAISPGFEVNDLGFQTQSDLLMQVGYVGYQENQASDHFRNWRVNVNGWHGTTFGGELLSAGANVNAHAQLRNYWSGHAGIEYSGRVYSPGELRGGPALRMDPGLHFWSSIESDDRKPLVGELDVSGGSWLGSARRQLSISPSLSWRVAPQADLMFGPGVSWNRDPAQYVAQDDFAGRTHYYVGSLRQTTVSLTTRLNYTVSPSLSFQLYAQPFVSAGAYSDFKEAVRPHASAFDDRFRALGPGEIHYDAADEVYRVAVDGTPDAVSFDRPDFNFKQFRSTAVLRWEYTPGSTLFLVWSQSRTGSDGTGAFDFGQDFGRLLGLRRHDVVPADNVFLIKLSYWIGK